jgi:hypothetical protein
MRRWVCERIWTNSVLTFAGKQGWLWEKKKKKKKRFEMPQRAVVG